MAKMGKKFFFPQLVNWLGWYITSPNIVELFAVPVSSAAKILTGTVRVEIIMGCRIRIFSALRL